MTLSSAAKRQATEWPPHGAVKVLVVADRPLLVQRVRTALNGSVHTIRAVSTMADVAKGVANWQPHLAIVDVDLGGTQRMGMLKIEPLSRTRVPVIGLTHHGDLKTRLSAFEAGVDDILTVPFAPEELLARLNAIVRRAYSPAVTFTPVIRLSGLVIDILNRSVHAGPVELHPTSSEQSLLYLLAANAGRVVSRDEILNALWGVDYVAESNVVDRHIRTFARTPA